MATKADKNKQIKKIDKLMSEITKITDTVMFIGFKKNPDSDNFLYGATYGFGQADDLTSLIITMMDENEKIRNIILKAVSVHVNLYNLQHKTGTPND